MWHPSRPVEQWQCQIKLPTSCTKPMPSTHERQVLTGRWSRSNCDQVCCLWQSTYCQYQLLQLLFRVQFRQLASVLTQPKTDCQTSLRTRGWVDQKQEQHKHIVLLVSTVCRMMLCNSILLVTSCNVSVCSQGVYPKASTVSLLLDIY